MKWIMIGLALGNGLMVWILGQWLGAVLKAIGRRARQEYERRRWWRNLPRSLREAHLAAGPQPVPTLSLGVITGGLAVTGGAFGGWLALSFPAGMLLTVACWMWLDGIMKWRRNRMIRQIEEQLGPVLAEVAIEMTSHGHVWRALEQGAEHASEPLKGLLRRAARALRAGGHPSRVLSRLGREMGSGIGMMFVHLLASVERDRRLIPLFSDFGVDLADRLIRRQIRRRELAPLRLSGLAVLIAIPLGVAALGFLLPDLWFFLRYEAAGRLVVLGAAVSVLGHLAFDRVVSDFV